MKINKQNYEEYALDYIEGTLSVEERRAFESFLETHPKIAAEIHSLRDSMPVITPDLSVRYEDKAALKRKVSVRPLIWRITAVAALLLVGLMVFNRYRPDSGVMPASDPAQRLGQTPAGPEDTTGNPPATTPEAVDLLADAAESPAEASVKIPAREVAPTVRTEPKRLSEEVKDPGPAVLPEKNNRTTGAPRPGGEIREVIGGAPERDAVVAVESAELEGFEEKVEEVEPGKPLLADVGPVGQVISVSRELLIEPAGEVLAVRGTRDYFAEDGNSVGLLNLLSRKGARRLAAGVLTPLAELSLIKVYENNEERVVEFASIPISRRATRMEENQ